MLLEEFDPNKNAMINPFDIVERREDVPKIAVSCFSRIIFDRLLNELQGEHIATISVANLDIPIYKVTYHGIDIAIFNSYVGASGCVGVLEEIFAMGVEQLVLFGDCGVLNADIEDCSIIIPTAALRDEGTSYHYAPAGDELAVNEKYVEEFILILNRYKCTYTVGKVWTTDAFYRETKEKVKRRKENGCICVDMECSAVTALAKFREKEVFYFFYAADNLDNDEWEARSLVYTKKVLEKNTIGQLAMEMAERITKKRERLYEDYGF